MPELPEVETVTRTLRPLLLGRVINRVQLNREDILQFAQDRAKSNDHRAIQAPADFFVEQLTGRRIIDISRRAKRIVFTLDNHNRFYIHLGMTGRLSVDPKDAPIQPHTHFIAGIDDNRHTGAHELRFTDPRRFGGIFWLGDSPTAADENLGPEPLTLRSKELAVRLAGTTRAIKSALLDQTVIAGLGNIYVDESLFAAAIHPLTPAHRLTGEQVARLTKSIKQVLRRALHHRGSTLRDYRDANGESGNFQKLHLVYQRENHPCPRCRAPIRRIVIGGRSTHFCQNCQKKPRGIPKTTREKSLK